MDTQNQNQTSESDKIEENFKKLEELIRKMEGTNQSIEEAFESYQNGMGLIKKLDTQLTDMEKKLETFNKQTGIFEEGE